MASGTSRPSRPRTVGATSSSSTGRPVVPPARWRLGQLDEQRHVDGLVVEQDAVLLLAVLAQALAVVGEQDDQRPVVDAEPLQLGDRSPTMRSAVAISPSYLEAYFEANGSGGA